VPRISLPLLFECHTLTLKGFLFTSQNITVNFLHSITTVLKSALDGLATLTFKLLNHGFNFFIGAVLRVELPSRTTSSATQPAKPTTLFTRTRGSHSRRSRRNKFVLLCNITNTSNRRDAFRAFLQFTGTPQCELISENSS